MPAPNKKNPVCPICGKLSRHKRTNKNGQDIYDCVCGWSNSSKRVPRSLLKRKELNAINAMLSWRYCQEHQGESVDISEAIGGEKWLYSCDQLVNDLKKLVEVEK